MDRETEAQVYKRYRYKRLMDTKGKDGTELGRMDLGLEQSQAWLRNLAESQNSVVSFSCRCVYLASWY